MKRTIATVLSVSITLVGCATSSKEIASAYVSPVQYQSYDCNQLANEMQRIQSRANQLSGRLDEAASNDKAIMGVGMILFWPALFALGGTKQQEAEYSRLKGEYDAAEQTANAKKCSATTVVASNQVQDQPASTTSIPQTQTKEDKLKELKRLHDAGLIAPEVYSAQQKAILTTP